MFSFDVEHNPAGQQRQLSRQSVRLVFSRRVVATVLLSGILVGCGSDNNTTPVTPTTAPAAPAAPTTTATSNTVSVSWTAVTGATSYELHRSADNDSANATKLTPATPISATTFTDSGLTASTAYYYWVKACNATGCSAFGESITATTSATAPAAPAAPAAPTTTATSNTVSVSWTAVTGATSYELHRSADNDSANATKLVPATPIIESTFTDSGLTASTAYYYWVKACNATGCSAFSESITVTTSATAPAAPAAPAAPTTTATSNTVSVSWTAVTGATSYELHRSADNDSANATKLVPATPIIEPTFTDSGLTALTAYYYWVKACNATGCSAFSESITVTTSATAPAAPAAPAAPTTTATSNTVSVSWTAVTGATSYELHRSADNDSANATKLVPATPIIEPTFTDSGLTALTAYYYWVKACNATGCSAFSESTTVTTSATAPAAPAAPAAPTTTATSNTVSVSWTAVTGATSYELHRSADNDSANATKLAPTTSIIATTFTDSGLTALTAYYYWVKACNATGCSAFSESTTVTTSATAPAAPAAPAAPTTTATSNTVSVSWTAVTGATSYELHRSADNDSANATKLVPATPIIEPTFTDSGLTALTAYYYWVKACNATGCSAFSESTTVTTSATAPDSTLPIVTSLTITSSNADPTMAVPGDTITVTLVANEAILLPPIRFAGQTGTPVIAGSGGNWTYTYRVLENFGLTETAELEVTPFKIEDIAGNLSEVIPGPTDPSNIITFTPDTVTPKLVDNTVSLMMLPNPERSAANAQTVGIALTTDEVIQEPTARIGTDEFVFVASADNLTWSGQLTRVPEEGEPTLEIGLSFSDLAGNQGQAWAMFDFATLTSTAMDLSVLSGLPPYWVLNAGGFVGSNVAQIITTSTTSFGDQQSTITEMPDSPLPHTLAWSLDDNGVLTLDYLPNTAALALFTTQFYQDPKPTEFSTGPSNDDDEDLSDYAQGQIVFEISVPGGYGDYSGLFMKVDHSSSPGFCACDQDLGKPGADGWATVEWPIANLTGATPALDLENVRTGIVLFPDFGSQLSRDAVGMANNGRLVIMLRNIRWESSIPGGVLTTVATVAPNLVNIDTAPAVNTDAAITDIVFTNNAASSGGGLLTDCVVEPSLPGGLGVSFTEDRSSCQITGTPSTPVDDAVYTMTATNSIGESEATISIEVNGHPSITILATATTDAPASVGAPLVLFDDTLQNGFADVFSYEQGTMTTDSASGLVQGAISASGNDDRGDVLEFSTDTEQMGVFGIGAAVAAGGTVSKIDLSAYANGVIQFDIRVSDAPDDATAHYDFKVDSGTDSQSDDREINLSNQSSIGVDTWRTVRVDLSVAPWTDSGLLWDQIVHILAFPNWGMAAGTVMQLDRITIYPPAAALLQ